jgi:hypothetical protein
MGFIVAIMYNAVINMYYRPIEDEVKQRFEQIEDMIIIYTMTIKYEDENKYCNKRVKSTSPDLTQIRLEYRDI